MPQRLVGRAQCLRPAAGELELLERSIGQIARIGVVGPVVESVEVVTGDDRRDLVTLAGVLQVPRHREVARLPVAAGERLVRHRAHERLHEPVLAALR